MRRRSKSAKAKVKPKPPAARNSPKSQASTRGQLEERLAEALDERAATSEILRLIGTSPSDTQPVFDGIARSGVRVCGAYSCTLFVVDGDMVRVAATHGVPTERVERFRSQFPMLRSAENDITQVLHERTILHLADIEHNPLVTPLLIEYARLGGYRTRLMVPMVRGDRAMGLIAVTRKEPTPFTDQQVDLLKTFADQAVIALENVRLFTELQEKNRALTEAHARVTVALEQQTATSEILGVISGSPTDVQPVFDVIAAAASTLCEADHAGLFRFDGDLIHFVAHHGRTPEEVAVTRQAFPQPPLHRSITGRAILAGAVVQIADVSEDPELEDALRIFRTVLAVPLMRDGRPLGTITVARRVVRPFADQQIALLQTFADQAVIAIENVRLFKELEARNRDLTEALEQQTATAEILRVISTSPTDLQPVLDTVVTSAARFCGAYDATIWHLDGESLRSVAHHGPIPGPVSRLVPVARGTVSGRAVLERQAVHVVDVQAETEEFPGSIPIARETGCRTMLSVPLLREGAAIGAISLRRAEVDPFTDKQMALLQTFADQAVIAIENVRLFTELEARTAQLTRSVAELQALGEVSRAVSSTLDVETVLDTIVSRARQLARSDGCAIFEYDDATQMFYVRATHNYDPALVERLRAMPLRRGEGAMGRAAETGEAVQIADIAVPGAYQSQLRDVLIGAGFRALLSVPLLREEQIIGSLSLNRKAPGEFSAEIIEVLKTFATQSALAIQNARLFRELADKSRQLEVASQHKSEFLANMSHELRTPLNAIIGFSEVLTERMFGELNEKQDEYLKDIHASGTHLLSLINDILDLSKIEAGRMELELADFNLPSAIDSAVTLVRERAARRGITLRTVADEQVGEVRGDERKIRQVTLNLLSNAIKFTPEGGRIEVRTAAVDGSLEVSVSDTGVGIAPEDQAAVFEEFRQVGAGAAKHEGTGLGLALCRKFVELHGGSIRVESRVGAGSTFTFRIPMRRGE